ncbi:hypothetical protein DMC30DRAFT_245903 [Rhodotorula diobovata]|uniref:Proteophosphoglycan ppg4 n=1 Tax=Rhodotorula diobovata TaxID=5288 RepID=A0A5C5FUN7_9BASI|nr:hypothetical protein DMC30DRAFT_245903 [Rhodotorula diobovata]
MALHTLIKQPCLRRLVLAVELDSYGTIAEQVAVSAVLDDLPGVSAVACTHGGNPAVRQLVAQPGVRVRRLGLDVWDSRATALVRGHSETFSQLERLDVACLEDLGTLATVGWPELSTLAISELVDPQAFEALSAPFRHQLVRLVLPISNLVAPLGLSKFVKLEHLDLRLSGATQNWWLESSVGAVAAALASAHAPPLRSLGVHDHLLNVEQDYYPPAHMPPRPTKIPRSTTDILDAIPPQIQHLSLDTDCFVPDDVASYLSALTAPCACARSASATTSGAGSRASSRTRRALTARSRTRWSALASW